MLKLINNNTGGEAKLVNFCSDFMAIYLTVVEILNVRLSQSGGPTDSQTDAVVFRPMTLIGFSVSLKHLRAS